MTIKYDENLNVDKAIATAIKSVKRGRVDVQKAAIAVLVHSYQHGDYSKANELVTGLGNSVNATSLVAFFVEYGGLTVDEEAQCFNGWNGKAYIADKLEDAKDTMWWKLKKANPFKGFNLNGQLVSLVSSYNKAVKKEASLVSNGAEDIAEVSADEDTIRLLSALSQGCTLEQAIESIYTIGEEIAASELDSDIAEEIAALEGTLPVANAA